MLPPDNEPREELLAAEYRFDIRGRIKILDKNELRKALGRSPIKVDALALTFAPERHGPLMYFV